MALAETILLLTLAALSAFAAGFIWGKFKDLSDRLNVQLLKAIENSDEIENLQNEIKELKEKLEKAPETEADPDAENFDAVLVKGLQNLIDYHGGNT